MAEKTKDTIGYRIIHYQTLSLEQANEVLHDLRQLETKGVWDVPTWACELAEHYKTAKANLVVTSNMIDQFFCMESYSEYLCKIYTIKQVDKIMIKHSNSPTYSIECDSCKKCWTPRFLSVDNCEQYAFTAGWRHNKGKNTHCRPWCSPADSENDNDGVS